LYQTELTYKSKDTEEFIDRAFYRPVGYFVAIVSAKLKLTPNSLTVFSILIGIIGSLFFMYSEVTAAITGILLLIISDIFDSADGQLARISGKSSKFGRILDGLGGNIIFFSIYTVFSFRLISNGYGSAVILAAVVSALSHSLQASLADYYRNIYVYYGLDKNKSELDNSEGVRIRYNSFSWRKSFFKKFVLLLYLTYTIEQEMLSKPYLLFRDFVSKSNEEIPIGLKNEFITQLRPMIKYYNFLTMNSRVIAIAVCALINKHLYYFLFEIVFMNIVLVWVLILHRVKFSILLSKLIKSRQID